MPKPQIVSSTDVVVEKNVPMPKPHHGKGSGLPFDTMDVGDSFAYPNTKSPHNAYAAVAAANVRWHPKKFSARLVSGVGRIWRTE